jgi:hypothetical protein
MRLLVRIRQIKDMSPPECRIQMKKVFIVMIYILIVLIVSLFCVLLCVHILNNIKAHQIVKSLEDLSLPKNTIIVNTVSFVGNTSGTGNHTEIYTCALVKSTLSIDEINDIFKPVTIIKADEQKLKTNAMANHNLSFNELVSADAPNQYFLIEWIDDAILLTFDLRGH